MRVYLPPSRSGRRNYCGTVRRFRDGGIVLDGPTRAIIPFTQPMIPRILPSSLGPLSTSYLSHGVSGKWPQPRRAPRQRTIATDMTRIETPTVFGPTLRARRSPSTLGSTPLRRNEVHTTLGALFSLGYSSSVSRKLWTKS